MSLPDAKRLKDLEAENTRLKKLLAKQVLENNVIKDALRRKWCPPQRPGCWRGAWSKRAERAASADGRTDERQRAAPCASAGPQR